MKEYNIEKYIMCKDIISELIEIIKRENISTEQLIDIINTLADFVEYNNYYKDIKSFNSLCDYLVKVIEDFNNMIKEDISINLISILENLKVEINNKTQVNIFFYGTDKYNILNKSINKNVHIISTLDEYKLYCKNSTGLEINILIVSEETIDEDINKLEVFNSILYYDKLMNDMFSLGEKIYYNNYDYYYLLKSIEYIEKEDVKAIVVGNSYPLTGIDSTLLDMKTINLSLSSQDLYYSYQLAKKVIMNNKNIEKCIIGAGYYLVNHDLSKGENEYSINMVKNVYYPILRDKHNSKNVEKINVFNLDNVLNDIVIKEIFDLDYLDYYFKDLIYRDNNGYFNNNFTRVMNSALRGISLSKISYDEKMRLGKIRAEQHNKLSKYNETTIEYKKIFDEFIEFLNANNIETSIVIFPTTEYYNKFLNKNYECEFYNIINNLKNKFDVNVVDFSYDNIFSEEDFIDFDHMSENGAKKITLLLNEALVNK